MAQQEAGAQPGGSSKNCLVITLIVVALGLIACIVSVILILVVVRNYQGLPPGALEGPDAHVTLTVLEDGCSVERGEVEGLEEVEMLTWVVTDATGVSVLERNAQNEYRYRYWVEGAYTVSVKAWYEGAYWTISDVVEIRCP